MSISPLDSDDGTYRRSIRYFNVVEIGALTEAYAPMYLCPYPRCTSYPIKYIKIHLRAKLRINVKKKLAQKRVILSLTIILHRYYEQQHVPFHCSVKQLSVILRNYFVFALSYVRATASQSIGAVIYANQADTELNSAGHDRIRLTCFLCKTPKK